MGHFELFVYKHAQVFLPRASLDPSSSPLVLVLRIFLTKVQDFALSQVKYHEVCKGPLLNLAKVPLDVIPFQQLVNHTTQLGVVSNLDEVLSIQMTTSLPKVLKKCQSQY